MNTRIDYLYRNGSNYKTRGSLVFKGTYLGGNAELDAAIKGALEGDTFIASQVGFPDLFPWTPESFSHSDDHSWHEYDGFVETADEPTDPRHISEAVEAFQRASSEGWVPFSPNSLTCNAEALLAALKLAVQALNTKARFNVPSAGMDSYAIAAICESAIKSAESPNIESIKPSTHR